MSFRFALLLAAIFSNLGHAAESVPQQLPEQEEQIALRKAEAVGLAIYQHDRAAWVATDAIATIGGIKPDKGVRGWITEEKCDDIVVTFIGAEAHQPRQALYRVKVSKEGQVTGPPQELKVPEDLTDSESGAAAARTFALKSSFPRCADDYNTVVLPADASATPNWVVYILPATKDPNRIPLGGAHRYELGQGREVGNPLVHVVAGVGAGPTGRGSLCRSSPRARCKGSPGRLTDAEYVSEQGQSERSSA